MTTQLLALRSLEHIFLVTNVFILLTQCDSGLTQDVCSVSGYKCAGPSIFKPCSGLPNQYIVCEGDQVCSDHEPSGIMCVPAPPPCSEEGIYPVKGHCSRYYVCVKSGPNKLSQLLGYCEPGLEFSRQLRSCVEASMSDCAEDFTTDGSVKNDTNPTPSPAPQFQCPSTGLHQDVTSCRTYYRCYQAADGSLQYVRDVCPRHLPYFQPEKRVCWYYDDKCQQHCKCNPQ